MNVSTFQKHFNSTLINRVHSIFPQVTITVIHTAQSILSQVVIEQKSLSL